MTFFRIAEVDRRQLAEGGGKALRRLFLSQRQHPAAVDQDLCIVPGKAFGKTLPVLHAGRNRLRQQQGRARLDRRLLIEGRHADLLRRMEEQAARLRQAAKEDGGFRHLGQFQIHGLGGELHGRQDPLRPQQHDLRVVAEQAEIDARVQEGRRQRRPPRQRGRSSASISGPASISAPAR